MIMLELSFLNNFNVLPINVGTMLVNKTDVSSCQINYYLSVQIAFLSYVILILVLRISECNSNYG